MRRFWPALVLLASIFSPASAATTRELSFQPSADAWVSASRPSTNYGSATTLEVDGGPEERALLRFEVLGVGSGLVKSAVLHLFNTNPSTAGGEFYRPASSPAWSESSVNWGSAPPPSGPAVGSLGAVASGKWYQVDLTAMVTGDGTHEIIVTSTSTEGAGYASREASSDRRPRLVVTVEETVPGPPPGGSPAVSITSPASGATVSGTVPVQASASGGVVTVEFFVDGFPVTSDATEPFGFDLDSTALPDGSHTLSATGTDSSGTTATSAGVVVSVDNVPDPPPPSSSPSPQPTSPVELVFDLAADAYVRPDKPSSNFGSAPILEVDASPQERSLLRFVVSGVGAGAVQSAKLRLYNVNDSTVGGDFWRLASLPAWEENTVTWDNAPATEGTILSSLGPVSTQAWYEVDLTSLVTGDGVYDLGITSSSSNGAGYASKDATSAATRPRVVVLYRPGNPSAPNAVITHPTEGSRLTGTVAVTASATDDVEVTSVDFLIDGVVVAGDAIPPYSFDWDTTTTPDGSYQLGVRAHDADGNTGTSLPVGVTVANHVDTTPPSPPGSVEAFATSGHRVELRWEASTDDVGVTGYEVYRDGSKIAWTNGTSYDDTGVAPQRSYRYTVRARDDAGNVSEESSAATVTTPRESTISFGVAGDMGANSKTSASLNALDASGANFFLAIGDLDYGEVSSPAAWCDYIKSRLPTLGPTFPFQLLAGNHEESSIHKHAACLPDRLGSTLGPSNQYATEYFFDYPAVSPLVRVIMISPGLSINSVSYKYSAGSTRFNWVASAVDTARSSGIPWVVVGMHKNCFISSSSSSCDVGSELMDMLVDKKVDLIFQGHKHTYKRGKQLVLSGSCSTIAAGYDSACVVDDGSDNVYTRGAGSIVLINGTFGKGSSSSGGGYFATGGGGNGFTLFTVSADRIDAVYVNATSSYSDAYSIR